MLLRAARAAWWSVALGVAALGVAAPSALAQESTPTDAQGQVGRVVVRGTRFIEDAAVLANVGLRPGELITPDKVRRDIAAVYRTGFFQDVQVWAEPEGDRGLVRLIFQVVEKPQVSDIKIAGNKKIDEDDLRELIETRDFGVLNEAKLASTIAKLRAKYVEKGFYLAQIEPVVTPVGENRVELTFQITENRKVLVQRIDFVGNEEVADRKIKKYMQTREGGFAPWLTQAGTFDRNKLEADQQTVQYVFLEEGYLDAKVDPAKVYLSPDKRFIYVSFHLVEGERYDVGSVTASGDFYAEEGLTRDAVMQIVDGRLVADIQEEQWRAAEGKKAPPKKSYQRRGVRLQSGDAFKYTTMSQVMENISRLYKDQGYAYVNVVPQTLPNPTTQTVDIDLAIDRGDKMRIGKVHISGNDPTFDKVVRREVVINEGDTYRGTLLDASRFRLMRLGFFEDVKITEGRGEQPGEIDLNVKVTEQPTGSFSLGLGYSNYERLAVNGSIQKNNFLGLGYNLSAQVNWSRLRRQASVSFFDPYFLDSRWTMSIDGYWTEQRFQLNQYQRGASLSVGRYLDRRNDVTLRMKYTLEDVGILSLDAYRQRMLGGELFRNGVTSRIGMSLTVDRRNNRIMPTKGVLANAEVSLVGGFRVSPDRVLNLLGGDFNFVELNLNFRWYQPLIPKSDMLVFRLNTTLGAVFSTDGRVVPFVHRYRAGGILSVRGFNWFSLGPKLRSIRSDDPSDGDDQIIVGGTATWINNFEIESPIIKAAGIKAVVFLDAGNAFGDPWGNGTINPFQLRTAAGFGVRWQSPIGPLRFEIGFPLRPQEGEKKVFPDFTIGSSF
jgi:outer membrane protein insertion porin family